MRKTIKQHPRALGILALWIIGAVGGIATPFLLYQSTINPVTANEPNSRKDSSIQTAPGQLTKGTPTYTTLIPKGKKIEALGGWTRVSPPNRAPVYAYVDKIGNVPINVSQQQLPKDFMDHTAEKVDQLAHAYAAETKLDVGDAIAYIGTSAKGPQSVIIVKNRVLILIKASASIPNSEWQNYIQSLS